MATSTRRAALYVRVSTADRGQTVENQRQPLQEAAGRLGWSIVAVVRDEGVSGARGRDRRTLSRLTTLTMPAVGVVRVGSPMIALPKNGRFRDSRLISE
jgi:predicted site-specific integrase-resolvase